MKKLFTFGSWAFLVILSITLWPGSEAMAQVDGHSLQMPGLAMAGTLSVRGLFTPQAVVQFLKNLPVLKTPVMDIVFSNRPQLGLPVVGRDDVNPVVRAMAFTQRGAGSIPIASASGSTDFFEPLPINPSTFVSAHELNNLKLIGISSREKWAQAKFDVLRRTIRITAEAVASKALSGQLSWPVQLEGGVFVPYEVDFGAPEVYVPGKLWDAGDASLKDAFEQLIDMKELLEANGYGSQVEIWAGKTAYSNALALALKLNTTAKLKVEVSEEGVNIGGFMVKRRTEKHRNPETGAMTPTVADNEIRMIALDAGHVMPYTALDDLDANLQPLPMFVKPIDKKDPSGTKLVAMSKPFASPNMKGVAKAVVTA